MKNLFFVSVAFSIFSGTSFTAAAQRAPVFIDGISIKAAAVITATEEIPNISYIPTVANNAATRPAAYLSSMATEMCSKVQFKFAQLLDRDVESLTNTSLFNFIDEWWQTRYRFGGTSKSGIDCSAFVGLLLTSVYGFKMPRTAREQYSVSEKINKDEMLEGDMVFFNTRGGVSHVGLYLGGGYFVHASVSSGVTISNLDEKYYAKKFIGAARANNMGSEMVKLHVSR